MKNFKNDQGSADSDKIKIFNLLNTIQFFKDRSIQGDDLHIVAQGLTFEEMAPEDYVFKAGTHGDKFYIILKGSVRILVPIKDKTMKDRKSTLFDKTEVNNKSTAKYSKTESVSLLK